MAEPSSHAFVGTRLIDGHRLVEIDNALVLDSFAQLDRILAARAGRNVAALFAEPRITRGNGAAPTRVDWYARFDGVVRPLTQLDVSSAAAVRRTLETRLAALRPLVFDPDCGPLVAAALNIASPDSIISVGGDPVLIDWGMLPTGVSDERARIRHFDATLGSLIAGMPLPPLSRAEWASRFGTARGGAASQPQSPPAPEPTIVPTPESRRPTSLRTPAIAVAIAALVLGFLMVPGVLSFPVRSATTASHASDASLGQMENRRRQLEAALAADCPALLTQATALLGSGGNDRPPAATPVRRN